jgi:hypothetical protein
VDREGSQVRCPASAALVKAPTLAPASLNRLNSALLSLFLSSFDLMRDWIADDARVATDLRAFGGLLSFA